MKLLVGAAFACLPFLAIAQTERGTIDTVFISAFKGSSQDEVPFSISSPDSALQLLRPRPQFIQQMALLPSMGFISAGGGINKPLIRGLSFNHIQLFGYGIRMDNQSWDDRHDIGIAAGPFTQLEIINGPAAILYGPNTMGGAMIFREQPPAEDQSMNGYLQTGIYSNSRGLNLDAGLRGQKGGKYFSAATTLQGHTNYTQGGGRRDGEAPMAFNSKYSNISFRGMAGIRRKKSSHQVNYSIYRQFLGILEDENMEAVNNPGKKAERDYEMEAPYQDVQTHVVSTESRYRAGSGSLLVNLGYQYNQRKEFEPGNTGPKSKFLAVGLNLHTVTADLQWQSARNKALRFSGGLQFFNQVNENFGNWVLVPDARIQTAGLFSLLQLKQGKFDLAAGLRADIHQLRTYTTPGLAADTLQANLEAPTQNIHRQYHPGSFSLGAVFHATPALQFKFNLASGFAAPNYAQLSSFGRHEGSYRFEVGHSQLKMTRNTQVDAGMSYKSKGIRVTLSAFMNSISRYIYIHPTGEMVSNLRVYRWEQGDARISGLEMEMKIRPGKIRWLEYFMGAGLVRGSLQHDGSPLPYIPANKLINGISWHGGTENWKDLYATIQLNAFASQGRPAEFELGTAGYLLTDIYLGAKPPMGRNHRWHWTLFATNLFNKAYFSHTSLVRNIGVFEPGRNIGLQFRYELKAKE